MNQERKGKWKVLAGESKRKVTTWKEKGKVVIVMKGKNRSSYRTLRLNRAQIREMRAQWTGTESQMQMQNRSCCNEQDSTVSHFQVQVQSTAAELQLQLQLQNQGRSFCDKQSLIEYRRQVRGR